MAVFKPFHGLRFTSRAGQLRDLVCPPYDIISDEQRRGFLSANPHNVIRLELPREGDDPYRQAGLTLREWLEDGVVARDDAECFYIYEIGFVHRGQPQSIKGLIGRVKLEEWSKGVVLPHEETLSKAKEDRFQLMQATGCNFSQVYSLYNDDGNKTVPLIEELSAVPPHVEFVDQEGLIQRLWAVNDTDSLRRISDSFADRRLYIADGHHRYETALRYRDWLRSRKGSACPADAEYVMMMLVDMDNDGLVVFPTHRVVHSLAAFDRMEVLSRCAPYFDVEECDIAQANALLDQKYSDDKTAFVFYADQRATLLTLRDSASVQEMLVLGSDALRGLDVTVLHSVILENIFGIDKENMAGQKNLSYSREASEAIAAVDQGRADCAFLMNPTRVSEIRDVALVGGKMPQKSTYFYPKLITGMVMNPIVDSQCLD